MRATPLTDQICWMAAEIGVDVADLDALEVTTHLLLDGPSSWAGASVQAAYDARLRAAGAEVGVDVTVRRAPGGRSHQRRALACTGRPVQLRAFEARVTALGV